MPNCITRLSIAAIVCALARVGFATDAIEEIVVAGFRETPLLSTTGSVSVIDQTAIADRAARHLEDTLNLMPNVNFSGGGSRARFIQVRGVGDLEQFIDPKHYPAIGITVDDIELGPVATAGLLLDVDQIELLRGPQGTRFGASASAGMVNIRSMDPTSSFAGTIAAGYANYDSWLAGFTLSGPLSDAVAGRLAVQRYRSDGFIDNAFLGANDSMERDELALRGKLHWTAGPGFRIDLTGYYLNIDNGYDAFSLDDPRVTQTDAPGTDRQELAAGAVRAEWDLASDRSLQAILTFSDGDSVYGFDEDWVYQGFCDGIRCDPIWEYSGTDRIARDQRQWSADLRLLSGDAGRGWVLGAYWQHRAEDLDRLHFGTFVSDYATERIALYGQLQLPLGDRLELIAGARVEQFDDDYTDSNGLRVETDDSFWTGELTLQYAAGDRTDFYATVARGIKPGGVNTEASSSFPFMAPAFQAFAGPRLRFKAETLVNKELGVKGRYFADRLVLRLALFHMARGSAQLESWMWDAANFIWVGLLDSIDDAENYGAELEFNLGVTDRVELFAGIGYLKTRIDAITVFDLTRNEFVTRSDREQTKAPRWQYSVGVKFDLAEGLDGRVELEGRGSSYYGYYHDERVGAYGIVNGSLSYRLDRFQVQVWGRNLFNKDYAVHGLFFANDPRDLFSNVRSYYQFGEPRVFGVNMSYAF